MAAPRVVSDLVGWGDPARPVITFYDDASGERVELSGRVFGNWVAKTANLLVDGLDAEPGDRVALDLPVHWQGAVWLFASWMAGLEVVERGGEDILAVAEARLPVEETPARDVVGLSLHALGMPMKGEFPRVLDYAAEVRSYGDRFFPLQPVDPGAAAFRGMSGEELLRRGQEAAERWGLGEGSRVLTDLGYDDLEGLLAGLIAPLSVSGSVIISLNLDKTLLDRRISLENVNAVAGVAGWNVPIGSVHRLI